MLLMLRFNFEVDVHLFYIHLIDLFKAIQPHNIEASTSLHIATTLIITVIPQSFTLRLSLSIFR